MARSKASKAASKPGAGTDGGFSLRSTGSGGGSIGQHRSMASLLRKRRRLGGALALTAVSGAAWLAVVGWVGLFWGRVLAYLVHALDLPGGVAVAPYHLGPYVRLDVPYLDISASPPSALAWWVTAAATVALFAASYRVQRENMPLVYIMRALAIVQATSLAYFAISPDSFPYDVTNYMPDMMMTTFMLIAMVPFVLGLTYYIFDFSVTKRLGLTLLTALHLSVLAPLQYAAHAWIVYRFSLLFLPALYLVFGLSLDVMVFVAFYAWGMSWKPRSVSSKDPMENEQFGRPRAVFPRPSY